MEWGGLMIRTGIALWISMTIASAEGLSIQLLNDEIYDTDKDLTGALKILYQQDAKWSYHIGQDIYTPDDKSLSSPANGERPYNAWLYIGTTYQHEASRQKILYSTTLDVGTIGPNALGEEMQNSIHRLLKLNLAQGWGSQTGNRVGFELTGEMEIPLMIYFRQKQDDQHIYLSSYFSAQAGTFVENIKAGAILSFGYHPPFYHTLISMPQHDAYYLFGSIEGIYVEKNLLLDGNDIYNVEKMQDLKKIQVGVNWEIPGVRIRAVTTAMSREYVTQKDAHRFFAVEVTVSF